MTMRWQLLLVAALVLCVPIRSAASAFAAPENPGREARLDETVRFLQEAQNMDGGFGGEAGQPSSQLFSAWVALALAAAAINPQDQAKPGGASVYAYLAEHVARAIREELCGASICTTAFERELLVVDASGTSPEDFGGIDLMGELLARKLPDGSFPIEAGGEGEINDTIFAILSLSPMAAQPAVREVVGRAAKWVIAQQNSDGSWSWQTRGSPGEADMTGAALEALNAAGIHHSEAQREAIGFLHSLQRQDGGFPEFPSEGEANSGSTAWVVQGVWAAGENPEEWKTSSGHEPLGYLEAMQQPDGHIRYRESTELNGVWMTAYAGPAYAGQPLPISAPARNEKSPTPPSAAGQGGDEAQAGSGVIAGGGGYGAPLFSRPQPNSRGTAPGGARVLKGRRSKSAARRHRNPGQPRRAQLAAVSRSQRSKRGEGQHRKSAGELGLPEAGAEKGADGGDAGTGEPEVKGVLIGDPSGAGAVGAPGLRGAGAGHERTQWLEIAIAGALLACFLIGAQREIRRPQVVL
jgi:hypothetical protein